MDWNAPLGMKPPTKPRHRAGLVAGCAAGALVLAGLGVYIATADPHGGEPYAVALIPPAAPKTAAATDPTPTGSLPAHPDSSRPALSQGELERGVRVFRGGATPEPPHVPVSTNGPLVIDVSKALDEQEQHKHFTSSDKAAPPAAVAPNQPRVAIFVSGMGLGKAATRAATAIMPAAVDLAFVPYGDTIAGEVEAAKAKGHEILLQLPMESAPGQQPGPHTLRAGEPASDVRADLDWLTSRFGGYAGITNLLGAPATADNGIMTAVLKSAAGHRVFYLDDGTSARSASAALAPTAGVPALKADLVLDATNDPKVVAANLDRLVAIARTNGQAIGMASGLPQHLDAIGRFAAALGNQGVVLVPVSALVGAPSHIATAR